MNNVLRNIAHARKQRGLSLENMAHELDLTTPAYRKIEIGDTQLSLDRLYRIAGILKVEVAELLNIRPKDAHDPETLLAKERQITALHEIVVAKNAIIETLKDIIASLKR
jgi:transcriptional regulator with XRE-family HTH domain